MPYTADGLTETIVRHCCFLPHELFACLSAYPELFSELLSGPAGTLEQFWEHTAETEWFQRHPLQHEIEASPQLCVPIGIHGDDAGVFSNDKVMVLTWGSVARELRTLDSRLLFCAVAYRHAVHGKSIEAAYEVLTWSLQCLAAGVWPDVDHKGRPLDSMEHCGSQHAGRHRLNQAGRPLTTAGHRGIWSEMRGDWKFLVEALDLQANYGTNWTCHLCRAHKKINRLLYTHFKMSAHLRKTRVSHACFRDSYCTRVRPHLFNIPGFNIWRVWADAMHCLDLGVYQQAAGTCLMELVTEGVWGDCGDDGFLAAHVEYKVWCRQRGVEPCPRFDRTRICGKSNEFPQFSQQSAKAAQTRYLIRWLYDVLRKPGVSIGRHGGIRLAMFSSFARFEDVCDDYGRFLPAPAREELAKSMESALLCMNALSSEALSAKEYRWHIVPKCHMATHLAFDFAATGVNPRRVTCYADEDMVGRVKKIVERCHGSTAPVTSLHRYSILVGTRWWTRLAELRGIRQA